MIRRPAAPHVSKIEAFKHTKVGTSGREWLSSTVRPKLSRGKRA